MKKLILTICVALFAGATHSFAQKLFFTRNGHIDFFSSTTLEDIKADNDKVTSIVNISTGEMEFSVLNIAFQFRKQLMQEHFNENYMETPKFPKSTFKGKIINIDKINFQADGTYPAQVTGDLTIHGVTKSINATGNIIVKDGKFRTQSTFMIIPENYNIKIPNLVRDNIAKEIKVTVDNSYEPFNK
jgi:polyisoprenoid-binding protein YceI